MLTDYKYYIFYFALFILTPLLVFMTCKNSKLTRSLMIISVFSTGLYTFLDINFLSHEWYRGTVRGFEVTFVDLIVLVLFLSVILNRRIKKSFQIPGFFLYALYLLVQILSLHYSSEPVNLVFGYFAFFQCIKGIIFYWTFYHLIRDEKDYRFLINALILIAIFNLLYAINQRYVLGTHRVSSYLGHPNLLGSYMNAVGIVLLVFYANMRMHNSKFKMLLLMSTVAAFVTVLLSISRGSIGAMAIGLIVTIVSMNLFKLTNRKLAFLCVFTILSLLVWYKSGDTVISRFQDPGTPKDARVGMNVVAMEMAKNNIFGVGYNNFSHIASRYSEYDNLPPAHSVYYLTLAELGFAGLAIYLMLWLRMLLLGAKYFMRSDNHIVVVMKGILIAFMVLLIHSCLEDTPRRTAVYYLINIYFAYLARGEQIMRDRKRILLRNQIAAR